MGAPGLPPGPACPALISQLALLNSDDAISIQQGLEAIEKSIETDHSIAREFPPTLDTVFVDRLVQLAGTQSEDSTNVSYYS